MPQGAHPRRGLEGEQVPRGERQELTQEALNCRRERRRRDTTGRGMLRKGEERKTTKEERRRGRRTATTATTCKTTVHFFSASSVSSSGSTARRRKVRSCFHFLSCFHLNSGFSCVYRFLFSMDVFQCVLMFMFQMYFVYFRSLGKEGVFSIDVSRCFCLSIVLCIPLSRTLLSYDGHL